MWMRTFRIIAGAVVATALVAGAAAGAAPVRSWHNPLLIVRSDTAGLVAGGLTARGDAIASGTIRVGTRLRVLVGTRHGFAAAWSLRQLSGPLPGATGTASALNDAGAAAVVWRAPGASVISAVRATRTGPWRFLAVPSGATARSNDGFLQAQASMTANGQVTALWYAHEQRGSTVRSAFRSGPNARWRATPALVPTAPAGSRPGEVRIAGNAAGDAIAAWSAGPTTGGASTVFVAVRAAHHAWGLPVAMPYPEMPTTGQVGDSGTTPSVAIAPDGRTALAWGANPTTDPAASRVIVATGNARTGAWATPRDVASGGMPSVGVNVHGALVLVWTSPIGNDFLVADLKAAVSADGAAWSTPQVLHHFDGTEDFDIGHVVVGGSGRAFAWANWNGGGPDDEGLLYGTPGTGVWTDAFTGSLVGGPTLAINTAGDAVAIARGTHATFGVSFDAVPRAVLTVSARGAWLPGHRALRWTVSVTNRGARPAQAVSLTASWTPATFVSARPASRKTPLGRAWNLGGIGVHRTSTVAIVIVPRAPFVSTTLWGELSAHDLGTTFYSVIGPK
jgi:hypothetical protein